MSPLLAILVTGDVVLALLALCLGFYSSGIVHGEESLLSASPLLNATAFALVIVLSSFVIEVYDQNKTRNSSETLLRISIGCILSISLLLIYSKIYFDTPGHSMFLLPVIFFGLFQFIWHRGYWAFSHLPRFMKKVLILGTGPLARQIGSVINSSWRPYLLSGYVNFPSEPIYVPFNRIILNRNGLVDTVDREKPDKIVVSLSERRGTLPFGDVLNCKLRGVEVIDAPSFYEQETGKLLIENITPSSFIFSEGFKLTAAKRFSKRVFDLALSAVGVAVFLPVVPVIAAIIKLGSFGPVLFSQVRTGKDGKNFRLYKFRTMKDDAEKGSGAVWAGQDDPRVTRFGSLLRKTHLDEIPQILNVVVGDMSFVGPRPERPEFIATLTESIPYYSGRHFVKPGISGWAQINYPYGASVEDALEKLRYDLFYVKHCSLAFDMLIVMETINVVLFRKGSR